MFLSVQSSTSGGKGEKVKGLVSTKRRPQKSGEAANKKSSNVLSDFRNTSSRRDVVKLAEHGSEGSHWHTFLRAKSE